jgi:hypothetical protein
MSDTATKRILEAPSMMPEEEAEAIRKVMQDMATEGGELKSIPPSGIKMTPKEMYEYKDSLTRMPKSARSGMVAIENTPLSSVERYLAEQAAKKEALTALKRGAMKSIGLVGKVVGPLSVAADMLDPTEASADADLRYTPEEQQQKLQEFHKMKKLQELLGK